MENPEEILHSLEEFSKSKPKDIPRELEEYLCFVAKTGDPVYQWSSIKFLLKEKLINVVNEFFDSCPAVDIPPCPNVEVFNYDTMKSFILEKLETFVAAPFTVQRICELLTTPRKEYNRIDKYMRALEKNILVVSTIEPGCKNTENGESVVNGLETEYSHESGNQSGTEINVVEMDDNFKYRQMEVQTSEQTKADKNKDNESEKPKSQETSSWLKTEQMEIQLLDTTAKESENIDKESASSSSENSNIEVEDEEKAEENAPKDSSVEQSFGSATSVKINVEVVVPQIADALNRESVDSSDVPFDTTDSEAVSSAETKESANEETKPTDESIIPDNEKQADSTTNSKPLDGEEISGVPSKEPKPIEEIQTAVCESSENDENVNIDSDSNQSSISTEPDTGEESQENTDSNEAREVTKEEREESLAFSEDSNLSPADTTKNMNVPAEPSFEDAMEEDKEQEISSSDKVVVSNSLDDITDDESEAEAEVSKVSSDNKEEEEKAQIVPILPENESMVTASSDELKKDCEEIPMEVELSGGKGDFNEAEATNA